MTRQSSSSPFISIREGPIRRVSFDTREELNDKIDKSMVMIGKLAAKDSGRTRQFKPQMHQIKGRGQNRAMAKEVIKIGIGKTTDQTVGIEDSSGKIEVGTDSSKIIVFCNAS